MSDWSAKVRPLFKHGTARKIAVDARLRAAQRRAMVPTRPVTTGNEAERKRAAGPALALKIYEEMIGRRGHE